MCTYVSIGGPGCGGDFLVRAEEKKKRPRHAATTCTRSNALAYPSVEERAAGPPVRAARTNCGIIMWNRDEGLPRPGSTIRRWSVSLCWSRFRAINIRKSSSCSERCAQILNQHFWEWFDGENRFWGARFILLYRLRLIVCRSTFEEYLFPFDIAM